MSLTRRAPIDGDMNARAQEPPSTPVKRTRRKLQAHPSDPTAEITYPVISRVSECATLDSFLRSALLQGGDDDVAASEGLYVTGMPGTGKTRCVRAAARSWRERHGDTIVLELNCMGLPQRTLAGVLAVLEEGCVQSARSRWSPQAAARGGSRSSQAAAQNFVQRLAQLESSIIIIADEVDQLLKKGGIHSGGGAGNDTGADALEALLGLPHLPGAPKMAIIAIANSVDLLERFPSTRMSKCASLLFEPYSVDQLRGILKAEAAASGTRISAQAVEICIRRVAKQSGDCRQALRVLEQAALEEAEAALETAVEPRSPRRAGAVASNAPPSASGGGAESRYSTPAKRRKVQKDARIDPLAAVNQLPLEQLILLCALGAGTVPSAMSLADLMRRHKQLCQLLRQNIDLASKGQVLSALTALEQRGLVGLRSPGRSPRAASRTVGQHLLREHMVELTVPTAAIKEVVVKANPVLARCWEEEPSQKRPSS